MMTDSIRPALVPHRDHTPPVATPESPDDPTDAACEALIKRHVDEHGDMGARPFLRRHQLDNAHAAIFDAACAEQVERVGFAIAAVLAEQAGMVDGTVPGFAVVVPTRFKRVVGETDCFGRSPWTESKLIVLPLAAGVALHMDPSGPVACFAHRYRALSEEARIERIAVEQRAKDDAERVRVEALARARRVRWMKVDAVPAAALVAAQSAPPGSVERKAWVAFARAAKNRTATSCDVPAAIDEEIERLVEALTPPARR